MHFINQPKSCKRLRFFMIYSGLSISFAIHDSEGGIDSPVIVRIGKSVIRLHANS